VKDFHFATLHQKIEPFILSYDTTIPISVLVNIAPKDMHIVKTVWEDFFPDFPFEFEFLDDAFDKKYQAEARMLTLFNYFSGLSIFIACMGLLGLTSFTVQQKTKEIGIRKVLGAGRTAILYLLSREFIIVLLFAILIAIPIAYIAMRFWLQSFAYQTDIAFHVFLLSAGTIALLALATISYYALKAAAINPVDSLRHE
jgi:putative ABC transport system permease protein